MNTITADNFNINAVDEMISELETMMEEIKTDISQMNQWYGSPRDNNQRMTLLYANKIHKHYAEIFGLPAGDFGFGEKD